MNNEITVLRSIPKDETVQLKGIAICCVILGHINLLPGGGAIGVEAFLVLSGYGIYQSYESKNLNNYWRSKLEKVWLPYFIWEILVLIFYRATSIKSFEDISLIEIIASLIGISPYNVIDKTMWYIPFIFIGYFAFWIISKRFKEKKLVVLFTIASLLLAFLLL